jgi:hypothetical protein
MRSALLLLAIASACGAPAAAPPPAVIAVPAAHDAGVPAPALDAVNDPGTLVSEEGTTLADGSVVVAQGDFVELRPVGVRVKVAHGDAELLNDRLVAYRDSQKRPRVRVVTPRDYPLGRTDAPLSLGDRATSGDWEVRWIAVRDGLVTFRGSYRKNVVADWNGALERRPTHELASRDGLFHLEVTMTAVNGDVDRAGTVAVKGGTVERAASATFGQSLAPGLYLFPDGLRIRVEQIANCDFDTSVPCFGGTYRAEAVLGQQTAHVDWSTRTAKVLRYTITLANFQFIVRK